MGLWRPDLTSSMWLVCELVIQLCPTLSEPFRLLCPWEEGGPLVPSVSLSPGV